MTDKYEYKDGIDGHGTIDLFDNKDWPDLGEWAEIGRAVESMDDVTYAF
jgi:hypothetical protein